MNPKPVCNVCYEEYNLTERIPRMIPTCGHTFCTKCISEILQRSFLNFKCPLDKINFSVSTKNITSFPVNFTLQELIEEESKYDLCQEHESRMRLVCVQDKCMVCEDCVLYGSHRGHEINPLKKIQSTANKKIQNFEASLKQINEWKLKFSGALDSKEKFLLEATGKRFKEMSQILKKKELDFCNEMKLFFDKERREMESCIGDESSIKKSITKAISNLQDVTKGKNILKLFQEDHLTSVSKFNDNLFQQQLHELGNKLQKIEGSVEEILASQSHMLKKLNFQASFSKEGEPFHPRSSSEAFLQIGPSTPEVGQPQSEDTRKKGLAPIPIPQMKRGTEKPGPGNAMRVQNILNHRLSLNSDDKFQRSITPRISRGKFEGSGDNVELLNRIIPERN